MQIKGLHANIVSWSFSFYLCCTAATDFGDAVSLYRCSSLHSLDSGQRERRHWDDVACRRSLCPV